MAALHLTPSAPRSGRLRLPALRPTCATAPLRIRNLPGPPSWVTWCPCASRRAHLSRAVTAACGRWGWGRPGPQADPPPPLSLRLLVCKQGALLTAWGRCGTHRHLWKRGLLPADWAAPRGLAGRHPQRGKLPRPRRAGHRKGPRAAPPAAGDGREGAVCKPSGTESASRAWTVDLSEPPGLAK